MDSDILHAALEKIRGDNPGGGLLPAETQALIDYLNGVNAKEEPTEAELVLVKHIRSVLQQQAVAARREKIEVRQPDRVNLDLRASLDKFLEKRYSDIENADTALMQSTARRLADMAAAKTPSPNEVRLAKLVANCLVDFEAWRSAQ